MTWYLAIAALQEPFDLGELDEQGRIQYAFNVVAQKRAGGVFLDELLTVLEQAGVGTRKLDLFTSSLAPIPEQGGPYLSMRETGGTGPTGTLDGGAAAYRGPGAQVLVRGKEKGPAAAMAEAAFVALLAVANRDVVAA